MSGVMGICPVHGLVSIDGVFGGYGGGLIVSMGTRTQCPDCGSWVEVIDGSYKYDHPDRPTVTLTPSPAQMLRLQTVAHWAERSLQDPDADPVRVARKLRAAVEKEAPGLAPLLDKALGAKGAALSGWVSALIGILAWLGSMQGGGIAQEDVVRIIEQVREYDSEHAEPSTPARPEPTQQPAPPQPAEGSRTTKA